MNRTERIKFWLTDKELKQIERQAKKARMNRSEYIRFLIKNCQLVRAPEITVLYWLTEKMIVHQKIPNDFFKLINLLTRIHSNVGHIWSVRNSMLEETKYKYYRLGDLINKYECRISLKGILGDPYYGEDRK